MLKNMFAGLCVVLFLLVGAIAASAAAVSFVEIEKVTIDVPLSVDEKTRAAIIDKLTGLAQLSFVYLDLSINFSRRGGGTVPYISTSGVNGLARENKAACAMPQALPMGAGRAYIVGPIANYNHLLLTVFTGARAAFPYHDVSCEYVASGGHQQFRIRGFFHILKNSIPTAISVQLRPLTPPFEQAAKVLAR